ncbi:GroES-like protein [Aspergillus tamarii]|uniref:GroES-like protein n=1 Tax=Aspergillus tamarii TaxID=41984 RepID=A0A5N6VCP6_ASPTM|nr:GroES-like protein [Aspergillus tamarii]
MQKAIVVEQVGRPALLIERPIPEPGHNQLLVRVTATSLNPADQKTRDEGLFFKEPPQVLGHEIAGEVIKIGHGAEALQFTIGEHIFAQANFFPGQTLTDAGALQQYVVVDARFAAKTKEAGLSDDEAATIPVCAIASFIGLFHFTGLNLPVPRSASTPLPMPTVLRNQAILIIGGGSNCGRYAIQFSRLCGFSQIITIASAKNEAELKDLGATHVIDRHSGFEENVRQVREITGDDLIYAFDAVNMAPDQNLGLKLLSDSKKGLLITLNRVSDAKLDPAAIGKKAAGYTKRMTFGFSALYPEVATVFWRNIAGWIKAGLVRPLKFVTVEGLDVIEVNRALDGYREGQGQKIVVKP